MKKKRLSSPQQLQAVKGKRCKVWNCNQPSDPCHIKTRGSGGDDVPDNLISLCREHHTEQGQSWIKFLAKYPNIQWELERKGWIVETLFGRTRLVRKDAIT